MKVRFITRKGDWSNSNSGKGFFIARLLPALERIGVECVTTTDGDVDIDFHMSRFHYKSKRCKKKILRLGPVHADTRKNLKYLNHLKQQALKRCDGVIYQSKFSKKMCDKFIGKAKNKIAIVFNGANPEAYNAEPAGSQYKYNFLASTRNWIELKRLPQIIESFNRAAVKDSCLWIAGDLDKNRKVDQDNIIYLGPLTQDELPLYYATCHTVIHGVYIDASPNAVTEALVAGCSVICGDQGGTHELGCQAVIPEKEWNFKPFNYKKSPKMDCSKWAEAIRSTLDRTGNNAPHLQIDNIAKQYKAFFEEVLNG